MNTHGHSTYMNTPIVNLSIHLYASYAMVVTSDIRRTTTAHKPAPTLNQPPNTPMPFPLTLPHKLPMGELEDPSHPLRYLIFEAHHSELPFANTRRKSATSTISHGLMGPLSIMESQTLRPPLYTTPSVMRCLTLSTQGLAHFLSSST
jgi:hypothetical protein